MSHVEQIVRDAGWFDRSPNGLADVGDLTPVMPTQLLSAKDWTAVVQRKRQELIDEICKNIPANIDDIDNTSYHQESSTEVKIVDKSYLTADLEQRWKRNKIS